jgi:hypothetical protein
MTKLEKFKLLRDELKAAYDTVLNNEHTNYSAETIAYAKKCYEDAEKAHRNKAMDLLAEETEALEIK